MLSFINILNKLIKKVNNIKIINFIINVAIAGFAAMGGVIITSWLDSEALFVFIIAPLIIWHFVDSIHNYRGD